jgi:hypothetical protein
MIPSQKSSTIDFVITQVTGIDRMNVIEANSCAFKCDDVNLSFRDDLSIQEYQISGLCQSCQDEVFTDN